MIIQDTDLVVPSLIARFMGPTWDSQDPSGPHVGLVNLVSWVAVVWYKLIWWISFRVTSLTLGNKDRFVNAPSQWEVTLHCNVVSHWLGAFTKWSLGNHMISSGQWSNPEGCGQMNQMNLLRTIILPPQKKTNWCAYCMGYTLYIHVLCINVLKRMLN